ncbi:ABC transporter permease subunit [bacterium]|nr:ABC transporter permease subunit [bacterium]
MQNAHVTEMASVYYIAKRTLLDILQTPVFWVSLALAGFICFSILFWGWRDIQSQINTETGMVKLEHHDGHGFPMEDNFDELDPLSNIKPETFILWFVYGITIGISSLLGIYIMLGLIGREMDRRTIDLLIARPVSRSQIYMGKLFAGWVSLVIFMALIGGWSLICMQLGGMGVQKNYVTALAYGTLAPIFISTITMVFTLWMHWLVAGFLANIILFASSTTGLFMIKLLGVEVLKMKVPVLVIYKILPPMNVIGQHATNNLETDAWFRMVQWFLEGMGPTAADGLYTEMWHVGAYFAIVFILGWLSFFRRQFT